MRKPTSWKNNISHQFAVVPYHILTRCFILYYSTLHLILSVGKLKEFGTIVRFHACFLVDSSVLVSSNLSFYI